MQDSFSASLAYSSPSERDPDALCQYHVSYITLNFVSCGLFVTCASNYSGSGRGLHAWESFVFAWLVVCLSYPRWGRCGPLGPLGPSWDVQS